MSQPNETNRQVVWIAENIAYDEWRIVSEAEAQDEASWAVPERLMSYEGFRLYKAEIFCEVRKDPITAQIIRTTQAPTYEDGIGESERRERAAVVAWLRKKAVDWGADGSMDFAADNIEDGEHRCEEKQ